MNLYVRNTIREAKLLIHSLGLSEDEWMPIGTGQAIVGLGFDKIVFDINEHDLSSTQFQNHLEWKEHVKTKINDPKNGKIITI